MKSLNLIKQLTWLLIVAVITFSCEEEEQVVGNPPVADAGSAINASVGSTVTLNGANSSDPDGDPLSYSWQLTQLPGGSSASIIGGNSAIATFVPDAEGTYTARLTVEDSEGNADSDDVVITVVAAVGNPPEAVITDEKGDEFSDSEGNNVVSVNSPVTVSGMSSFDLDSDPISFEWSLASVPAGSSADFANPNSATAEFTPDIPGEYIVSLTVDDGNGNTNTTTATITAEIKPVIIDSHVTENTTWENIYDDPSYPDYRIIANIDIMAGLTVDPGVYVEVLSDKFIEVTPEGYLNAVGTGSDSIKFTSANIAGGVHWVGILFNSGHALNELTYTEVSYGGSDDIDYISGSWRTANIGISEDGKLTLKHSRITNSEDVGLVTGGEFGTFESNEFIDNASYAMSMPFNEAGKIDGDTDIQNNGSDNYIEIYGSTMTDDQIMVGLKNSQSYIVTGNINLESQLNINEGVRMAFTSNKFFEVTPDGNLIAEGASNDKIILTSSNIDGGEHWGGLIINSGYATNALDHVEVSHAGGESTEHVQGAWRYGNVVISDDGKIAITNSVISNSDGEGVFAGANSILDFSDNGFSDNDDYAISIESNESGKIDGNTTFSGNSVDGVRVYGSDIDDAQTMSALSNDAVYLFTGDVDINDDVEIEEGTIIHFDKEIQLTVTSTGSLKAIGTTIDQIVLTSHDPDSYNWAGLLFESKSSLNELQYVEVSHGGSGNSALTHMGSWIYANIAVDEASLKMNDCTISNSENDGIVVGSSSDVNGYTSSDVDPVGDLGADNNITSNGETDIIFL